MPLRSAVKQSLGTLTAALFVLGVAAVAAWTVGTRPRNETMLEADLKALQDLGIPTDLADVKRPTPENTFAAERYEKVGRDFNAFIAKKGSTWYQAILGDPPNERVLKNALPAVEAQEMLFSSLLLAVKEREFVPKQDPMLWDSDVTGRNRVDFLRAYRTLHPYLKLRMRVLAAAGRPRRATESVTLALRMAEQIAAHPSKTSNSLARQLQESGFTMADELSRTFPTDRRLQIKLLALMELSKPADLKPALLLQPAIAFTIIDSTDPLPSALVPPDVVTRGVPSVPSIPKNSELANSSKVRREIKALLASHYRTLLEDFPQDETDTQTIAKLLQNDSLEQDTLAARIAKFLADDPITPSAANLTHKKRQQVIDSIRSRLEK
jgi:hypothetical protein